MLQISLQSHLKLYDKSPFKWKGDLSIAIRNEDFHTSFSEHLAGTACLVLENGFIPLEGKEKGQFYVVPTIIWLNKLFWEVDYVHAAFTQVRDVPKTDSKQGFLPL